MVLAAAASARQARVVLQSNTTDEVQIDGRTYNGRGTSTINDLPAGQHSVAVYRVTSKGIFGIGKKRSQISYEPFTLRDEDVNIAVNQDGRVRISQDGYYGKNKDNRRKNDDFNNGQYGKSEGKGRGHKYGHYKNKNGKYAVKNHKHHDDNDDDEDDRNDRRRDND